MGLSLPPLRGRPRAWGAEVGAGEQGGPAGVPILTFDKERLGQAGAPRTDKAFTPLAPSSEVYT